VQARVARLPQGRLLLDPGLHDLELPGKPEFTSQQGFQV